MSPKELSRRHPFLYHVTSPSAEGSIRKHGLLSTKAILDLCKVDDATRLSLMTKRRPDRVALMGPEGSRFELNDNKPFSEKALIDRLDDNLRPADWLKLLNGKVFFWARYSDFKKFENAAANQNSARSIWIFDTLRLVECHFDLASITPFNTGATRQSIPRRGLKTFAPLASTNFEAWRHSRKQRSPDTIREVAIDYAVPNALDFLVDRLDHDSHPAP